MWRGLGGRESLLLGREERLEIARGEGECDDEGLLLVALDSGGILVDSRIILLPLLLFDSGTSRLVLIIAVFALPGSGGGGGGGEIIAVVVLGWRRGGDTKVLFSCDEAAIGSSLDGGGHVW